MKNQEHNNNLDQLFNKAKADKQGLDDFEKDAFAGFETLGSEQEAKDLKAALDTRINKELFNKEEKNNPKIYWFAAAGLALVIGLTALFVSNNNDTILNGGNLAISNIEQKNEEKISTDSEAKLKEETVVPAIAETKAADEAPAKEIVQKDVPTELNVLTEPTKGVKKLEEKEELKPRMIVNPAAKNETPKDGYTLESENERDQSKRRKENSASGTVSNNNDNTLNNQDDLARNDKAKEKINTDYKSAASTTKAAQNKQAAEDAEEIKDELAINESKKGKLDEKSKDSDDLQQSNKQPVLAGNNNINSAARENGKSNNQRAKKSAAKQNSVTGPGDITYSSTPKTTTTQEVAGELVAATPAEAETKPGNALITCSYNGGETALTKDLKEKLKAENLDQKFDATLFINEKKIVEKVEFTNAYGLTANQKEDVIRILMSLTKFNVPTSGKKESFTYKLLYRP